MSKLLFALWGDWLLEITGGSPQWLLNSLTRAGIPFWGLQWSDPWTVHFFILPRDLSSTCQLAEKSQCQVCRTQERGLRRHLRGLLHRPVLLIGIFLTVLSLWLVPRYLLFYEVRGNENLTEQEILQTLEGLGIGFGTDGRDLRPKWVRDQMLQAMPELQWIAINQTGCVGQVLVRERSPAPEPLERRGYAHVIAACPGLITRQSVLAGQPVVQPGDIVAKGELLVSGLVDLERTYTLEYAQAEIFARTWHKSRVYVPETVQCKGALLEKHHSIWLEVGKTRIKIFGNSGISPAICDKMVSRKILSLSDRWKLPVSILVETTRIYETRQETRSREEVRSMLVQGVREGIQSRMQDGEILLEEYHLELLQGAYVLTSQVECEERISQTVEAKWNKEDIQYDN